MKTIFCAAIVLISGTAGASAADETKTIQIEITNPYSEAKTDEPISLCLEQLEVGFTAKSAVVMNGDDEIPSQLDDYNQDLRADELAFVIDLPANSTTTVSVTLSSAKTDKTYPARTYAQMLLRTSKKGKYAKGINISAFGSSDTYTVLHHHGVAFESELNAWRIYFNEKQTTDLYGKFNKGLEIEESLFYPTDEQLARGFGDDVILVRNSCGAGTLKGWNGEQATHISPVEIRGQKVIASGPVRAIVEAEVKGWQYQGSELNMVCRYTIYAGHRDAQVDILFDEPLKEEVFVTGVQHLNGDDAAMYSDHEGLVGSWGTDWPVNDTVKYHKETVGLGTFIPKKIISEEKADKENYLYTICLPGEKTFRYWTAFTSKKETFGYDDSDAWFEYLKAWKKRMEQAVEIKIVK